jgi:hypothetical protein
MRTQTPLKKHEPEPEPEPEPLDVVDDTDIEYLGEIDLENTDFTIVAESLLSDVHTTMITQKRKQSMARAFLDAELAGSHAPCFPGCMTSALHITPVFKYDKVVVLISPR